MRGSHHWTVAIALLLAVLRSFSFALLHVAHSDRRASHNRERRHGLEKFPSPLVLAGQQQPIDYGTKTSDYCVEVVLLLPSYPEAALKLLEDSAARICKSLLNKAVNSDSQQSQACEASFVICNQEHARSRCEEADALIALGVEMPPDVRFLAEVLRVRRASGRTELCQMALGGKSFAPLLGKYDEANPTWEQNLPWTRVAQDKRLLQEMQALFDEGEVEDFVTAIRLFIGRS